MSSDKKYRAFTGILYPDSSTYVLQDKIEALGLVFDKWAYITHDRDLTADGEPKKAHVHWIGYRKAPVMVKTIAGALSLRETEVEFAKRGWRAIAQYLIHLNDNDKYQYSSDDVVSNFDYNALLCDELTAEDKARGILNFILTSENCDLMTLGRWSLESGFWSEFVRAYPFWSKIINERKFGGIKNGI